MNLTVAICTRNPDPGRLHRVLNGLGRQDLSPSHWQITLIDNGSNPPVASKNLGMTVQVIREEQPGLFHARMAAIRACETPVLIFIDDDTVPHERFLSALQEAFQRDRDLVCAGPRIIADYEQPPPDWIGEFEWALALRDLGEDDRFWHLDSSEGALPNFTPVGAGLALRVAALNPYLDHVARNSKEILKRSWKGQGAGGNEDKDMVYTLIRAGSKVGYVGRAKLAHIIPSHRCSEEYLQKILPALGFLSVRTRHAHDLSFLPPIAPWTLVPRICKAWWSLRAWRHPAPNLRFRYRVGLYRGLADNFRDPFRYAEN